MKKANNNKRSRTRTPKRRLRIRLKELRIRDIKWLIKKVGIRYRKKRRVRGRPRKYTEEVIITLLFLKVSQQLSLRSLIYWARQILKKVPSVSTLHYRFKRISLEVIKKIEGGIIEEIIRRVGKRKEIEMLIIGGRRVWIRQDI